MWIRLIPLSYTFKLVLLHFNELLRVRRLLWSIKQQQVVFPILPFTILQFSEHQGSPVGRETSAPSHSIIGRPLPRFTVSPPSISIFLGVFGLLVFCVVWVVFCFVFAFHDVEIFSVLYEFERPSELSWRARHGKKTLLFDFVLPPSSSFCCPGSNAWLRLVFDSFQPFRMTLRLLYSFRCHCRPSCASLS